MPLITSLFLVCSFVALSGCANATKPSTMTPIIVEQHFSQKVTYKNYVTTHNDSVLREWRRNNYIR